MNNNVSLAGYINSEHVYFDSIHSINKSKLSVLDSVYDCYVGFKVDANGIINDFRIVEIPVCRLPVILKEHIREVFEASSGRWMSDIRSSHKLLSDEIVWFVSVVQSDQTITERAKVLSRLLEYYLDPGFKHEIKTKSYLPSNRRHILSLSYCKSCQ